MGTSIPSHSSTARKSMFSSIPSSFVVLGLSWSTATKILLNMALQVQRMAAGMIPKPTRPQWAQWGLHGVGSVGLRESLAPYSEWEVLADSRSWFAYMLEVLLFRDIPAQGVDKLCSNLIRQCEWMIYGNALLQKDELFPWPLLECTNLYWV